MARVVNNAPANAAVENDLIFINLSPFGIRCFVVYLVWRTASAASAQNPHLVTHGGADRIASEHYRNNQVHVKYYLSKRGICLFNMSVSWSDQARLRPKPHHIHKSSLIKRDSGSRLAFNLILWLYK
jgi:hypothetical protein